MTKYWRKFNLVLCGIVFLIARPNGNAYAQPTPSAAAKRVITLSTPTGAKVTLEKYSLVNSASKSSGGKPGAARVQLRSAIVIYSLGKGQKDPLHAFSSGAHFPQITVRDSIPGAKNSVSSQIFRNVKVTSRQSARNGVLQTVSLSFDFESIQIKIGQ